jgi:gamma-glutamyl:cysteine ligase YbdK (ATP-grasp superfamily)
LVTSRLVVATGRAVADEHNFTLGVQVEFLLLDPDTGSNVPAADEVIAALPTAVRRQSRLELRRSMVEMATSVCTDLGQLREQLTRHRRMAGAAAATAGARLVAVGATPLDDPQRNVPHQPRYQDCPTADDTVLVAALIRALVATMIDDEQAGAPVEDVRDCVLSAAH